MKNYVKLCLDQHPELDCCGADMRNSIDFLCDCFEKNNKLLLCGNGGSASDSSHIAAELLKSFGLERRITGSIRNQLDGDLLEHLQGSLPAISLPDFTAINTAYINDCTPEYMFAQLVFGLGAEGDGLFALSTSGNSQNIILAARTALAKKMKIIGLTGKTGGQLVNYCTVCIRVPETETYKIQELHIIIYHTICLAVEQYFFNN
ncbi:MAG: SIS domain-containing protein [Puniceicoccales bacterium]|nr:SIS domain-containing protein [Puniceicoccales bacterium]